MLFLFAMLACDPEDSGVQDGELSDCDPISHGRCASPFPSSFYERADSESPTGVRVRLGPTTIPATNQDAISYQPDPALWNELDGFSPLGPLLVDIPNVSVTGLPGHANMGDSLLDDSQLVLVDVDSGERHAAWAELDYAGAAVEGARTMYIRPASPLLNGHRYVVGLRGLVDTAGSPVAASEGFAALRDGEATDSGELEARRATFDDVVFPALEATGWARSEVTLAWDFMVKSTDAVAAKGIWMRDDAQARLGPSGAPYVIDEVQTFTEDQDAHTWKRIYGTMSVPLYTETDGPGTLLTRGSDGMPEYNGETSVPFIIIVPRTAETDPRPLKLLQYGHGLLGDCDEVEAGYLAEIADRHGFLIFASNWTGMKGEDTDAITLMILNDLSNFPMISERSQQGFVEFHALLWTMKGAMVDEPELQVAGQSLVDPSEVFYYGNSQGGILGGAYVALSADITRATLGVGGMPYSLLLSRSSDFTPFFAIFQSVYDDQRDLALWMGLLQQVWDPGEAGGYGRQMNVEPLPGTPAKTVLIQDALGDSQVTTLGAHNMARAYGAVNLSPPVQDVWGVEEVEAPVTISVLAEYDHGAPIMPQDNTPPDDETDTHEDTRRAYAAQEQMVEFFLTGSLSNHCEGACFCAEGACDAAE